MSKPRILVSDRAQILMPYHVLFNTYEEMHLAGRSSGSTKSGIAPLYSNKCVKIGLQTSELLDQELLREEAYRICELKNVILEHLYHRPLLGLEEIIKELLNYRDMVEPYVCDTFAYPHEATKEGKKILLEDQPSSLKNLDHGICPVATPSSTLAAYEITGTGIPPYEIKDITTAAKTYSSAVGTGAFANEISGGEADELRDRGDDGEEYGVTTGGSRRVGWFDAAAIRYGCRIQGITGTVLAVPDVLRYLDETPVCVGYEIDERITREFSATVKLKRAKPVFTRLPGRKCNIRGIRKYEDLPKSCRKYIEPVEREIEAPVSMVSSGSRKDGIIIRKQNKEIQKTGPLGSS